MYIYVTCAHHLMNNMLVMLNLCVHKKSEKCWKVDKAALFRLPLALPTLSSDPSLNKSRSMLLFCVCVGGGGCTSSAHLFTQMFV